MQRRSSAIKRVTKETQIDLRLTMDGTGKADVQTGVGFFDHMLTLFAKHAVVDLKLRCKGDLEVDAHHTVEDCGIALGQAFLEALGDKKGIRRYGTGFDPQNPFEDAARSASSATIESLPTTGGSAAHAASSVPPGIGEAYVPMDECLARCVIDFSGRPFLVWRGLNDLAHKRLSDAEKTQDMSSYFRFGLAREFFQGFANEARCNLHIELLYGDEPHHVVEALFKAFAKAMDVSCQRDPRIAGELPSTK